MSTTRARDLARPVLARLRAGDTPDQAAAALDLDPGLVAATVAQLVHLGLARVAGPTPAGGSCSRCPGDTQPVAERPLPSACAGCPLATRTLRAARLPCPVP